MGSKPLAPAVGKRPEERNYRGFPYIAPGLRREVVPRIILIFVAIGTSTYTDVIQRLYVALPLVRAWIDQLLATHAANARKVSTLGFNRLASCYPADLLERARVVSVERTPFPPVSQFDLPEFAQLQGRQFEGITFNDTFFVVKGREFESLHFHELVHVVQWSRLGVDNFLLAYGLGLLQFGYEESPLEQMAYSLQQLFERGAVPNDLVRIIENGTDEVWKHVARVVGVQ